MEVFDSLPVPVVHQPIKFMYRNHESKAYFVFLTEPPLLLPIEFGSEAFYEGDMAQANCRLRKGDRPITISWLYNGIDLVSTDDTYIDNLGSRTSILTLDPVRAHHQGNYSCRAANEAGITRVDTTVIVNGTQRIFMESVYVGYRFY